jgi:hypothetical protein
MTLCKDHKECSLSHRKRGKVQLSGIYRIYLGSREKQKIWIVDGEKVAMELYSEFIMGGNDQRYRFNPPNDVWIDNRIGIEELEYTIAHELIERRFMRERGWSYNRAHDEGGLAVECNLRRRNARWAVRKGPIYRAYLGLRQGASVWIVDGPRVRKEFEPDFCFGAHDLKSPFIPTGEVWLDSAMAVEESFYTLKHQLIERSLMSAGTARGAAYMRALQQVHRERVRQAALAARHESALPSVTYGVRERGVIIH